MSASKRSDKAAHHDEEPATPHPDLHPVRLAGELTRSYMRMCAQLTTVTLDALGSSQRELMRSMRTPGPASSWAPAHAAASARMLDAARAWFELFSAPLARSTRPRPAADLRAAADEDSTGAQQPGRERRTRAVVISFPDRRRIS